MRPAENHELRVLLNTVLKIAAGIYFVVTSLYCLLAFLPYTYAAFIRTPPYAWMPFLARHQAGLYWLAIAAAVAAGWRQWVAQRKGWLAGIGLLAAFGIYLAWRPFLPAIQSNTAAYAWSLLSLFPLAALAAEQKGS